MGHSLQLMRYSSMLAALVVLAAFGCRTGTGPERAFTHPSGQVLTRSLSLSGRPFGVAVSQSGTVLVGLQDESRLAVIGLAPSTAVGYIDVGAVPTDVRVSPSGALAAVSNQFSGSVGFVSLADDRQEGAIATSAQPFRVLFSSDGRRLYVSNNSGTVDVIDVSSRTRIGSVPAGEASNGLALSPDGRRLYVTAMSGGITVVDLSSSRVVRTIPLTGVPQGIVVSPDGSQLYVATETAGMIVVLDANSGSEIKRIDVGPGAFDLSLSPDGTQLYVTLSSSGTVKVVDRASGAILQTLLVGGTPRRVSFTTSGDAAVVGNESGWVDIIR